MGGRAKCRTARSSSRKCLDHMTSNPSTQTLMFPGRGSPLCSSEVVKMLVALTRGEDRLSDSVGGLSCLSCVLTKLHMSTRTSV
jgi:hypothetical protein